MPLFVKITRIPFRLLTACLLVVCFSGGYAIANRSFDVKVMVVMGIVAYFLNLLDLPTVPMVLGLILGPTAEFYLRNALSIGNGNWMIFFQRPICIAFMALLVLLLVMLSRGEKKQKQRKAEVSSPS